MPTFRTEVMQVSKGRPRFVPIAPGLAAESPLRLHVGDWNGYDLQLDVVALPAIGNRAGRFVCCALTVKQREGGPPVTTEAIRGVPVATLVRGVGARHWMVVEQVDASIPALSLTDRTMTAEMVARFKREGPTDEALTWVARAYRMAAVLGDPPTQAVERAFEMPRSTTGRWVALARERGFLGAAEGAGKAGG